MSSTDTVRCTFYMRVPPPEHPELPKFFPLDPAPDVEFIRFDGPMVVEITLHDVPAEAVAILYGMPHYFRFIRPALPAPPPRHALPWGDSAYATWITSRWLPGDPAPAAADLIWACGPPDNGFTPSSEGPRRDPALAPLNRYADMLRSILAALRALE